MNPIRSSNFFYYSCFCPVPLQICGIIRYTRTHTHTHITPTALLIESNNLNVVSTSRVKCFITVTTSSFFFPQFHGTDKNVKCFRVNAFTSSAAYLPTGYLMHEKRSHEMSHPRLN